MPRRCPSKVPDCDRAYGRGRSLQGPTQGNFVAVWLALTVSTVKQQASISPHDPEPERGRHGGEAIGRWRYCLPVGLLPGLPADDARAVDDRHRVLTRYLAASEPIGHHPGKPLFDRTGFHLDKRLQSGPAQFSNGVDGGESASGTTVRVSPARPYPNMAADRAPVASPDALRSPARASGLTLPVEAAPGPGRRSS
jgi:hypothetical protein